MINNAINFLASSFLKTSDILDTLSNKLAQYSGSITPAGLTDEYWSSLESITQWNKPAGASFLYYSSCVTRSYHLENEQLLKYYNLVEFTNNETEAMQFLFRSEYEDSISYTLDKIIQLPAHLLTLGSVVADYSSYIPYTIGKGLEYSVSAIESLNTLVNGTESKYEETSLIPEIDFSYDSAAIAATLAISML
ncbi:hypothetical protein H1Q59_02490 [Holosporaceae bacterium 'Namur']|nr:hypothetical protein [Holosporaceae bacterium 'Namur']